MAEEIKNNVEETTETNVTKNQETVVENSISKAEYDKLKSALDKALKEKGDITKQLRAKQSEDERLMAEQAEQQRIREEEYELLKAENNRMKAVGAYKSISNEKVVEKLIEAVSNADHNEIALIIDNEIKAAVKSAQAEWLKSRPQANIGTDTAITRDEIMAIKDSAERQAMMAQHIELFRK
jgi:hypothetical protein